eukprot:CAMPEP_0116975952 /NCGR_PEP_ID=MMETSP0467-20121206/56163_1 /TAXON_ID=283647 /ORGANISM="Mesodinium pulex, Strain SPMC105" /LENGTH=61 /DNA_ID=CAMNT_0004668571 /DNA_START=1 /DNA_END=183 /DNA_ORIENTATION=-
MHNQAGLEEILADATDTDEAAVPSSPLRAQQRNDKGPTDSAPPARSMYVFAHGASGACVRL